MSMSNEDRAAIDQLFGRLADTERRSPPRDAEAEAFIRDHVGRQPGAPYFMAQTIVMQDYALKEAERRIAELEGKLSSRDQPGSLYPSGFGAGSQAAPQPAGQGGPWGQQPAAAPPAGPWSQNAAQQGSRFGGGGFLAGAAQTAMGVAGGVLLGNAIGSMFGGGFGGLSGGERVVEENNTVNEDVTVNDDSQSVADADTGPADDGGGFFDSFFGGGDDTV